MRAVVLYESEFGNTHLVADAIARGLAHRLEARALPIHEGTEEVLRDVGLLVIGGPTHAHGLSRPSTRRAAVDQAHRRDATVALDEGAEGPGIREWFDAMPASTAVSAAFDTRVDKPAFLTGRASKAIGRRLADHGFAQIAEPESFLVTPDNRLVVGELGRAEQWGVDLSLQALLTRFGDA